MGIDYSSYGTPRLELGEALREYMQEPSVFIGTRVFPLTPVTKVAAKYPVITKKSLTARADTVRAARSAYNRTGMNTEDAEYSCTEHGLESPLDATERKIYASDFDAELETTRDILMKLLREQEIRIASLAMSETTFSTSDCFMHASGVWSTAATAIIKDIQAAKTKVFDNSGMEANALIISRATLNSMLQNTDIIGRIQYAQSSGWNVVKAALANLVGIDEIIVGNGVYDSKPEGATAASLSKIWSDTYALVAIVPGAGGRLVQPAVGRTFLWTEDSPENVMVESYDEEQTRSTIYRVRQYTQEKVIENAFGCLIDVSATS